MEKTDVLNDFFASVFTGNWSSHSTQVADSNGKNLEKVDLPAVSKMKFETVKNLKVHKSVGPDVTGSEETGRWNCQAAIQHVWKAMTVSWSSPWLEKGKHNIHFQEGKKEDPGNYWPIVLTSETGKTMEQILLKALLKHIERWCDWW